MSSADTLVYDMSQMTDKEAPSVFVKRDWLNILDSQNGNYNGNQLTIDTSQLSNSNKYMSYRQAYLSVPMVMAVSSKKDASGNSFIDLSGASTVPNPTSASRAFSLKSWFGSIIHSMVLDYAGSTIIQQTSLCGMWNCFTLMTSLSHSDLEVNGVSLGFFPDDVNFQYQPAASANGIGTCNNQMIIAQGSLTAGLACSECSNAGMWRRMANQVLDPSLKPGGASGASVTSALAYDNIVPTGRFQSYYRSTVTKTAPSASTTAWQGIVYAIQAQIFLKHIHSFFANCPLMKGVFFRLTLNINQPTLTLSGSGGVMDVTSIISPLGGVVPILVAGQGTVALQAGADEAGQLVLDSVAATTAARVTLNVGNKIIDPTQSANITASGLSTVTALNQSCQLYIPAYTFNPSYEEAYLSRPTKRIQYTDIYQFTTSKVSGASSFNFLLTNGISNVRSVLILPFYSKIAATRDFPPFQSPFDPAGCGPTSPLTSLITNFNVIVSGQNMIYNTQNYGFEEFLNQFVGVNSINGNQTDGLTSGLVDFFKWNQSYCYWYVDCSRMLPVDASVPKSVSIQGNLSLASLQESANAPGEVQFYCFIEYGVEVSLDVLTGARV